MWSAQLSIGTLPDGKSRGALNAVTGSKRKELRDGIANVGARHAISGSERQNANTDDFTHPWRECADVRSLHRSLDDNSSLLPLGL
jgi:hypothetical protein